MNILIKNCNLISIEPSKPKIEYNTNILIKNGKIKNISNETITTKTDKVIDGKNKYVIPGMFNCHNHIPMSLFREITDGYKLQDWLEKAIWPIENKMTNEDIYSFSKLTMLESLENGVTTLNDMYFKTEEIIKAKKELGINCVTSVTLMDIDGEKAGEERIQNFRKIIKKFPNELFSICLHGFYTCSPAYVKKCVKLSKELNINLFHVHFCENTQEVETIKKNYNVKNPTEILLKYLKNKKIILAHGVKLNDTDISNLKKLDVSIALNLVSNLRLGCGIPNIKKLRDAKINLCLGTDGQGSGSNLSILSSARFACLLTKGITEDPTSITAYDVLKMATIDGATALNLQKTKGSIAIGKDADLCIIDFNNTETFPINDPINDIIYNAHSSDIAYVLVNGKIIINNRKCLTTNKNKLIKECTKLTENIKKR